VNNRPVTFEELERVYRQVFSASDNVSEDEKATGNWRSCAR
jgi:hypothetical protein